LIFYSILFVTKQLTLIGGGAGAGKSSSIMYLYEQGLIAATDSAPGVVYINHDQIIQVVYLNVFFFL